MKTHKHSENISSTSQALNSCVCAALGSDAADNLSCIGSQRFVNTLMLVGVAEMVLVLNRGHRMSLRPWPVWDSYHYGPSASSDKSTQDFTAHRMLWQQPAVITHAQRIILFKHYSDDSFTMEYCMARMKLKCIVWFPENFCSNISKM